MSALLETRRQASANTFTHAQVGHVRVHAEAGSLHDLAAGPQDGDHHDERLRGPRLPVGHVRALLLLLQGRARPARPLPRCVPPARAMGRPAAERGIPYDAWNESLRPVCLPQPTMQSLGFCPMTSWERRAVASANPGGVTAMPQRKTRASALKTETRQTRNDSWHRRAQGQPRASHTAARIQPFCNLNLKLADGRGRKTTYTMTFRTNQKALLFLL